MAFPVFNKCSIVILLFFHWCSYGYHVQKAPLGSTLFFDTHYHAGYGIAFSILTSIAGGLRNPIILSTCATLVMYFPLRPKSIIPDRSFSLIVLESIAIVLICGMAYSLCFPPIYSFSSSTFINSASSSCMGFSDIAHILSANISP